jgi:6,7-dimethyl-8-ribityllumazine synthase
MSTETPSPQEARIPSGARVAIVAARFNESIVEKLIDACRTRLSGLGVESARVELFRVPGAFELPLAAQAAARTGRFAAIICLGAIIRGQTPHFDYVAGQCARGIARVSLDESIPVIFGVLTTDTPEQALARLDAGTRAAEAAAQMIVLMSSLRRLAAPLAGRDPKASDT